jgi:N-terminal domain of toast_rack, DUF2154
MTHSTIPATRPTPVPANNRFRVGMLVGALVSLGLVGIALGTGAANRLAAIPLGPTESRAYTQPFDGASRASVRLQFGAGDLTVGALERDNTNLATANFAGPSSYAPEATYRVRDDVAELAYLIRDVKSGVPFFRGDEHARMNVRLAQTTPLMLNIEAGASDSLLDLSALQVTQLDLQTGVADTRVRLPQAAGHTSVSVHGGVSDLSFEVPQGVAADIRVSDGLASRQIDERRFQSMGGGHYRSAEYDTAANRIDMQIELGIATLRIQ